MSVIHAVFPLHRVIMSHYCPQHMLGLVLLAGAGCCCCPGYHSDAVGCSLELPGFLPLPKSVPRGQVLQGQCTVYGAAGGHFRGSWYTGTVDVEIACPPGIEANPAALELEMKPGKLRNSASAEVTITVHPGAKLGKHAITVSGKKADGTAIQPQTYEIEVTGTGKGQVVPEVRWSAVLSSSHIELASMSCLSGTTGRAIGAIPAFQAVYSGRIAYNDGRSAGAIPQFPAFS